MIRKFVFVAWFSVLIIGIALFVLMGIAVVVRERGFEMAYWILAEGIPKVARKVEEDPWLVPAFVVTILFIWSLPLHKLRGDATAEKDSPEIDVNHIRGRRLYSAGSANQRAYQALIRKHRRAVRSKSRPNRRKSKHARPKFSIHAGT